MVTKRIVAIRDRKAKLLKIKSYILKILNLKKNMLIATFAEVGEKSFKATKFIFKSTKLIGYCIN